jgi:hypothetical protein
MVVVMSPSLLRSTVVGKVERLVLALVVRLRTVAGIVLSATLVLAVAAVLFGLLVEVMGNDELHEWSVWKH